MLVSTAFKSFFQTCSLRSSGLFETLPNSFDALSEVASAQHFGKDICRGLEETRQIDSEDLQSWKMWFTIIFKCLQTGQPPGSAASRQPLPSPPSPHYKRLSRQSFEPGSSPDSAKYVLSTLEKLVDEGLVFRTNVVLIADALHLIVSSKTQSGVPIYPARDRKRAVTLFKRLRSVLRVSASEANVVIQHNVSSMIENDDDALWTMLLATLRTSWDDVEIESEVTDSLAAMLFKGVGLLPTNNPERSGAKDSTDDRIRRVHIAFERVLFPLVTESKRRRPDAVWLLSRFFLACASMDKVGDQLVDELLLRVIDCISADFADSDAVDDSKESAVQTIVNIVNVVVRGTPFEEQRMALVSKELDIILPSGWRDSLISVDPSGASTASKGI